MPKVKIDDLAITIARELDKYDRSVTEEVKKAVRKTAADTRKLLKQTSPNRSGEYADGWSVTTRSETTNKISLSVNNRGKHKGLTHLLEFGHASRNGSRVEAQPHILPAQEEAAKELQELTEQYIKGAGI